MRKCTKCKKIKALDRFSKKIDGKLGKKSHCKDCVKVYERSRKDLKSKYDAERYKNKKDYIKKVCRDYYNNNKEKYRNYEIERKRLTNTDLSRKYKIEIQEIYKKCKQMNKMSIIYHVDHIIPLKGKNVCGLHVPWNLRIITKEENLKKSNKVLDRYL